jgi:hypothetical protein
MMSKKSNQNLILSAVHAGLLISGLFAGDVIAAECGQAKLVEAGSSSVNVTKNTCSEQSRIGLGSVLELSSGSRMWLKFDPSATGETFQLICQNKAADTVKVNVASTTDPWIKPEGVKNCDKWKNNKLSCESNSGESHSFFCAIAKAKVESSDTVPKMTTSVKMRAVNVFSVPVPVSAEDVIKNIKPEIELCKNLYNVSEKVGMGWTVSLGKIQDLTIDSNNSDFVACVEAAVKQANADQDLSIKYSF